MMNIAGDDVQGVNADNDADDAVFEPARDAADSSPRLHDAFGRPRGWRSKPQWGGLVEADSASDAAAGSSNGPEFGGPGGDLPVPAGSQEVLPPVVTENSTF